MQKRARPIFSWSRDKKKERKREKYSAAERKHAAGTGPGHFPRAPHAFKTPRRKSRG